jgi:YbbR domain-containing protein
MKWLVRNWGIKLVSLFLAVGLWYYAVGEEEVGITRTVPLEIKLQNPQLSILKVTATQLQVTLTAPRALFSEIVSDKIYAIHSIGKEAKTAGDYSFRVEPSEIKVPNLQIRVLKVDPAVVGVTLDELITKKMNINPVFLGEPAFGYRIHQEEIQLDPNAVLIGGPKGALEKLESVDTEKIDLVGRIRPFRRTVSLNLPAGVKSLNETPVDIYVPIKEEFEEKSYENIPVRILNGAEAGVAVKIEPSRLSFVLKGSKQQFEKLPPEKMIVYVDAGALSIGQHELPAQMILPDNISVKDEQPLSVKVTVTKA